ncbi:MFS transporter [Brochothrix thermosphacta]|uniref:MFS transporter n=1 Tax=Brochothrix thermosphacta TaxID=2756 RepID=UPI00083F5D4D|nr:MFS transporter [Brochothrix thermosphacta]ODJ57823.1 transporter [Brochothrix thermosphacta]
MNKIGAKLGFKTKEQFLGFSAVVLSGQLIYSSFEAFKGTFYDLLLEILQVNNAQLGVIFSLIGISIFFYIPGGWINNRFSVKSILIVGLVIRMLTTCIIIFFTPTFTVLKIVAVIWGLVDAFFWPAVLNGIVLLSGENNKGVAFGILESGRRALEMFMNLLIVAVMALIGGIAVFKGGMLVYNLLIIPVIIIIIKYVPVNGIAATEKTAPEKKKSIEALKGMLEVIKMPTVWLASITALTIYWSYINLIYTVPYLQAVFGISRSQAALFGIINTGAMGVVAGIISGALSDYVFKSSSKMMFVALFMTFLALLTTLLIPKTPATMGISIALLMVFSFSIFLAKSVILTPIAESKIPEEYSGSSMSIGSFAAYAPVFWAYNLNGTIIDKYEAVVAYEKIFQIGTVVALFGVVCSLVLVIVNKRSARNVAK